MYSFSAVLQVLCVANTLITRNITGPTSTLENSPVVICLPFILIDHTPELCSNTSYV